MRTNKARAQAVQHLLQDSDNAAPLLPLDPSQRISLHRQLRSRYNPCQIPFSSLSCARYVTASDVAQLAAIFHQFSLFSPVTGAVETAGPSKARRSSPTPAVDVAFRQGGTAPTSAKPAVSPTAGGIRTSPTAQGVLRTTKAVPAAAASATSSFFLSSVASPPAATRPRCTGSVASAAAGRNWRLGECVFSGNGMTLLHDVATPPPPRVLAPSSSPLASPTRVMGQPALSPRWGVAATAPVLSMTTSSSAAGVLSTTEGCVGAVEAPSAAAMSAMTADGRDVAEPFTAESNDCAVTVEWLVEVLLEMVLANYESGSRRGNAADTDDRDGKGAEKKSSTAAAGWAASQRSSNGPARSGDYGNTSTSTLNLSVGAVAGHPLSTTTFHARCRDSRVDFLVSAKAELMAWAGQLQQRCDPHEHFAVWQNCALQEEVLARYQLCVVHTGRVIPFAANHHATPLNHKTEMTPLRSTKLTTYSPELGVSCEGDGAGGTSSPASPLCPRRTNVSWRMPDSLAATAAGSSSSSGGCRPASASPISACLGIQSTASPHALRGIVGASTVHQEPPRYPRDDTAQVEVLFGPSATKCAAGELAQPLAYSSTESFTSDTAAVAPPGVDAATSVTEPSYLASKANLSAPELKDLLQRPTKLNGFLWTSAAAAEIAMAEELRAQQQQHARSARIALSPTALTASESLSLPVSDASRTFVYCETPTRAWKPPHPQPSSQASSSLLQSMPPASRALQQQQQRRRRAATVHHLVCWSDVASNLLMGLETTWFTQQHELSYVQVPTALLEDVAEGVRGGAAIPGMQQQLPLTSENFSPAAVAAAGAAAANTASGGPGHAGTYDDDVGNNSDNDGSVDEGQTLSLGAAGKGGQCRRRRLHKTGSGTEVVSLQQQAMLLSSLGAAAEATVRTLHAQSADHIVVSPSQKYLVTSSKDGMLKVWETGRGQFVDTILNVEQAWVLYMCFLHSGEYLMVATSAAEVTVVNFPSGGVVLKLRGCTSLATAVTLVKQPSTAYTQRYGLKPGECGHHNPAPKHGTSVAEYRAATAVQLGKQVESESVPIAARPIIGYVAPTCAFYEEELGHLFFGTLSGMVGCVDLAEPLSRSGLLAAAAGARWKGPLHVHSSVYAHPDHVASEKGVGSAASAGVAASGSAGWGTRGTPSVSAGAAASSGAPLGGLRVSGVFYCGVGHCVVSADCAGGVVRTSFTAAADTLAYALGTPVAVMATDKPVRFMVCCPGGRRFVTVHSDRRALLWGVGRTTTELMHQYPQEAYDIVDVCFLTHRQQVALLMEDRSIHVFDERGTRAVSTIQPPRGFSRRVEDIASVTLKYSASDGEGCLAYLPDVHRIVCGLRGPVLYEPAVWPSDNERNDTEVAVVDVGEQAKGDRRARAEDAASQHGSATSGTSLVFLPLAPAPVSPSTSPCLPRERAASVVSMLSGISEVDERAHDRARRRRLRRQEFAAAVLKAQQRLLPYQTHTTAVVGILLYEERNEVHTISTDTWTIWNYKTGTRVRTPVQVPAAAARELALRSRACRVTCCAWSSGGHTRLLLGTRGSRVLTLDAAVGSVVGVTEPLTAFPSSLPDRRGECKTLDDKDVSVIACCGTRTLICCGRVCEVRRYEQASAPQPSGEERFVAMQVQLPAAAAAAAAVPSAEPPGSTGDGKMKRAKGKDRGGGRGTSPRSRTHPGSHQHSPVDGNGSGNGNRLGGDDHVSNSSSSLSTAASTITACCVVRESYLCLGTSDTQLFFYRMVDHSSPIQVEVLCDASGEPDVGQVMSLHYVHSKTQDMLLAVVDTGVVYVYSYTLQRMIARYTFPCLGTNLLNVAATFATARRGRGHPPQKQHYLTKVSLIDDSAAGSNITTAASAAAVVGQGNSLHQLLLCCGDSAGYVHIASMTGLFADTAAASAATTTSAPSARTAMRNRELRVVASFHAATSGVSALEVMRWSRLNAATALAAAATSAESSFLTTALVVFAGGFDGSVRVFCLLPAVAHSVLSSPHLSVTVAASGTAAVTMLSSTTTRHTRFSLSTAPSTSLFSTTVAGPTLVAPFSATAATEAAPTLLCSPLSPGIGVTEAVVSHHPRLGEDSNINNTSSSSHSGPLSGVVPPSFTPNKAGPTLLSTGGSLVKSVASGLHAGSGSQRYHPLTVGLCGVDTWDLHEMETFADVKQANWLADFVERQEGEAEDDDNEERHISDTDDDEASRREELRLPSVLDEDDVTTKARGDAARQTSATIITAARDNSSCSGYCGGGGGEDGIGGAVLLRDVLRQAKKRFTPHSGASVVAVSAAGGDADGGGEGAESGPPASQRRSSPTARAGVGQRGAPSLHTTDAKLTWTRPTAGTTAAAAARTHSAPPPCSHTDGVAAPLLFTPHTISEVVGGTRPSTSKGLALPQIRSRLTTTASLPDKMTSSEEDFHLLESNSATLALSSSLGPQPRPFSFKMQQNPLLRTYPVALLRQMGVLHPQDDMPDLDPITNQPTALPAEEAFRRRAALKASTDAGAPHVLAVNGGDGPSCVLPTVRPNVASCNPLSLPSNATSATHDSIEEAAMVERPSTANMSKLANSLNTADGRQHPRGHSAARTADKTVSSSNSSSAADEAAEERGCVEVVSVPFSSASDGDRLREEQCSVEENAGENADGTTQTRQRGAARPFSASADEERDNMEVSVFLTEGPAHDRLSSPSLMPRPRPATVLCAVGSVTTLTGHSTATTALPATLSSNNETALFTKKLEGAAATADAEERGAAQQQQQQQPYARVSVSMPDILQTSTFNVPFMTEDANVRWNAAQRAQPPFRGSGGTETPQQRRSRASYMSAEGVTGATSPSPPSTSPLLPKSTRAQRDLALLRSALQGVNPQVLKIREDQMMLSHAADLLDRSLRRPIPNAASLSASGPMTQRAGAHKGNGSAGTVGVGEFTARLLRVWHQRSGDAAVDRSAGFAHQQQLPLLGGSHGSQGDDDSYGGVGPDEEMNSTSRRSAADFFLSKRLSRLEPSPGGGGGGGDGTPSRKKSLIFSRLPSNAMLAVAASKQATPGTGFGLDLFTLTVPSEPPQLSTTRRGGRGGTSADFTSTLSGITAAQEPLSLSSASATAGRAARSLPQLRMKQDLHPIQVTLPSTLQKDEGERMLLRRFEASIKVKGSNR
jgi:hypothetical protein